MNSIILDVLQCPDCGSAAFHLHVFDGSPSDCREGVVWCANRDWFPVEQRVLEFLPRDLQYGEDRARFRQKHASDLEGLGLLAGEREAAGRSAEELNAIHVQQRHFDWYAENDRQAYNAYAAMPFWRIVDRRTTAGWKAGIGTAYRAGGTAKLLLDVGCAQGRSALLLAQPGVHLIGFDISKRMVQLAYLNFSGVAGGPEWNDFIVADGSSFPFQSGAFDYVLVGGVLHHLPDPAAACRQIARVLKSGGTYFGSENNRTVFRKIFDLLQRLVPAWHEEAGAEPLMSSQDVARWFEGTGLKTRTSTIVYLPPHLVNMLGTKAGGLALAASDAVLTAIPYVKNQGGLILIEGTKA